MTTQKRIVLLLIMAVGMTITLVVYFATRNGSQSELFVVWGIEYPESTCFLEIINPNTQTSQHIRPDVEQCSYGTAMINGQKKLVHVQSKPAQVLVYAVTESGFLEVEQTLDVNNDITMDWIFPPYWDSQGNIYFTGTLEGHEQIFQMDVETGKVAPFIARDNDATSLISLSPDGRMILYVRYEGFENTGLCQLGCYPFYRLYNLEDGLDLYLPDVIPEINKVLIHSGAKWSPTGQYLAFQVGNLAQRDARTIIYDIQDKRVVKIISPTNQYGALFRGWFSETEVIYITSSPPEAVNRYSIYDISTGNTRELMDLPAVIDGDTITTLRDIDWTSDGNKFTAEAINDLEDPFQSRLIIVDTDDDEIVSMKNGRFNRDLIWSPSGKWIGFYSNADELDVSYLTVVDARGNHIFDKQVQTHGSFTGGYDWLTP